MLTKLAARAALARTAMRRATVLPFLVRCAIAGCGLVAMAFAWPQALVVTELFVPIALVALLPAFAPRGRGATISALVVVAGWLLDTASYDGEVALWRVLTLATLLYLGHTLAALAAVLPYDAIVNFDVIGQWLGRALVVIAVSAMLTVAALGMSAKLAGGAFLVATFVGLIGAVGATMLLARLLRRA